MFYEFNMFYVLAYLFRCGILLFIFYFFYYSGILPRSWCRYTVPTSMTVIQWVADFSERIKQLQQISQAAASGGAKELKVLVVRKIKWNTFPVFIFFHFCLIFKNVFHFVPCVEHPCVPGQPVCAGGLHHCYSPICGAGQQLVSGRAVSGGQCHHSPRCCAGRLQLWHQRSDQTHSICCTHEKYCAFITW